MRDVVIVGAGHNALVAACYLAREGLDVEVVERDTVIGGAASTVERFPGYQVDRGSSAHIMIRHTGIVEDLKLDECGLRYLDCDPWAFAPYNEDDGRQHAITFSTDLGRTCDSIARMCGDQEAEAYAAFAKDWGGRNARIFEAFQARADDAQPRPEALERRPVHRTAGPRAGPPVPPTRRRAARRDLPGRAAQDRAVVARRPGRPAHPRGRDRRPRRLEHGHAPAAAGRPVGGSGMLSEALAQRFSRTGAPCASTTQQPRSPTTAPASPASAPGAATASRPSGSSPGATC